MVALRDYQQRIFDKTLDAIGASHRNILIEGACGSGKTVLGHFIARELHERFGYVAGWCAMRRHLIAQSRRENEDKIGFEHIRYFSMFDKNPPKIDVLLSDECHHTAAESAVAIYQKTLPKIHIGLTATPYRTDRMKLMFSKVIRDAGIRALIDRGYLAPFHHYTFDDVWTPETVAQIYLRDRERWGKTIIYFLTKRECDACAEIIASAGVPVEVVWAGSDQESQIDAFQKGDVPVLVNIFILTEGFNDPSLETVMVRPSSRGPTIQMTGRVLRPKPFAQVVQNNETKWPFTRTASAEKRFVLNSHGIWEDRNIESENITMASRKAILAILSRVGTG